MTVPSAVTSHVLDTSMGRPAAGLALRLERVDRDTWSVVADAVTDEDGRARDLGPARLAAGRYRLRFDTAAYFDATGREAFYPEVVVVFTLADPAQHYHVPLLLSPFGYTTYRGS